MSQPPESEHVYFIINKKLPLAWDNSHYQSHLVVGTPPKGEKSQKWRFERKGEFWIIENLANEKYVNIKRDRPIPRGDPVTTALPRKWLLHFDEKFDGWRIINPESRMNAEIAIYLGPPHPEPPVLLAEQLPEETHIWRFEETHP